MEGTLPVGVGGLRMIPDLNKVWREDAVTIEDLLRIRQDDEIIKETPYRINLKYVSRVTWGCYTLLDGVEGPGDTIIPNELIIMRKGFRISHLIHELIHSTLKILSWRWLVNDVLHLSPLQEIQLVEYMDYMLLDWYRDLTHQEINKREGEKHLEELKEEELELEEEEEIL